MSIQIKNLEFVWPNGDTLFQNLHIDIPTGKVGLIGRNGTGKSTLLKLLAGHHELQQGSIELSGIARYISQGLWSDRALPVLETLGVAKEYQALQAILSGSTEVGHYEQLGNRWELEQEIATALNKVGLELESLEGGALQLSGGEFIRLQFASIYLGHHEWIFLDEPSNHLDSEGREILFQLIDGSPSNFLIVSHDKELLNRLNFTIELSESGSKRYGGNFDFYQEQKSIERAAIEAQFKRENTRLKKQIRQQQSEKEKSEKKNAQGKKRFIATGGDRNQKKAILDGAAKTQKNQKRIQGEKRTQLEDSKANQFKLMEQERSLHFDFDFEQKEIPKNKLMIEATEINISFHQQDLWEKNLSFRINGSERWQIKGKNGSGKTSLFKLFQNRLKASKGALRMGALNIATLDQHLNFLNSEQTVLENLKTFSEGRLPESEIRTRANRLGFDQEAIHKKASVLSGGESLRLALACILATNNAPDLLLLDEPTNNLDIESKEILLAALQKFKGSLLLISHDTAFKRALNLDQEIDLDLLT